MSVRQAAQVLDLLEYFAKVRKPAGVGEISAELGWPRSSTYNLLNTLAERGFIYEPKPRGGYYPTSRWYALSQLITDSEQLPEALRKAVDDLAAKTKETVAIAARAGAKVVLLYVAESSHVIRFSAEPGFQMPIQMTASGRALLSLYSPRERSIILKKVDYARPTDQVLVTPEQVEAEIKRGLRRGWHEKSDGDLNGVALPIVLGERQFAVVVAGPANRMRGRLPELAAILKRTLSRHLSGLNVRSAPERLSATGS